jgi:hypothetical protein
MNNKIIITLIIALTLCLGFIAYDQYKEYQQTRDIQVFQAGAEAQVIDILQIVSGCEAYPITIENQTINLIAVRCLQQAE